MLRAGTPMGRPIALLIVVVAILALMMAFGLSHLSGTALAGDGKWAGGGD